MQHSTVFKSWCSQGETEGLSMVPCRDNNVVVAGKPGMQCPIIKANVTAVPLLSSVTISPAYFDFQVIMVCLSCIQANMAAFNCRVALLMHIQLDICRGANALADLH